MSEERNYPTEVIRELLVRHRRDVQAVGGNEWLAKVIELLGNEVTAVPPPVEQVDTIPKYIYPH